MTTLTFDENEIFETDEWKQKMSANGGILKRNNVRLVLLVHGTFAGDDALGLFELLAPVNKTLADSLRKKGKALIDGLSKDVGNYTTEYADALGNALDIACELLIWSSGNYHIARLKGAVKLAQELAKKLPKIKYWQTNGYCF